MPLDLRCENYSTVTGKKAQSLFEESQVLSYFPPLCHQVHVRYFSKIIQEKAAELKETKIQEETNTSTPATLTAYASEAQLSNIK